MLRLEAAGCYGRNCADDAAGDAALLSRAARRPVRVQLSRADEHGWEPKGAAQLIDVRGGLDEHGMVSAYDFDTRWLSGMGDTQATVARPSIATRRRSTPCPSRWCARICS